MHVSEVVTIYPARFRCHVARSSAPPTPLGRLICRPSETCCTVHHPPHSAWYTYDTRCSACSSDEPGSSLGSAHRRESTPPSPLVELLPLPPPRLPHPLPALQTRADNALAISSSMMCCNSTAHVSAPHNVQQCKVCLQMIIIPRSCT